MLTIVTCPICASDQFAAGPIMYWREYETQLLEQERRIENVEHVYACHTLYCSNCDRLIRSGTPYELEMDLVQARREGKR